MSNYGQTILEKLSELKANEINDETTITIYGGIKVKDIHSLDFSFSSIKELPEAIGYLSKLTSLNVSNTQLTTLPDSIGNLTSLQILNGKDSQLTTLPESIGNLTDLRELEVNRTKLTTLPESIGNLNSLKQLNIGNTQLTILPESIGKLIALQKVNVNNTQLITLPESIGNLTSLRRLDVSNTQLTNIPKSIGNLSNLQILYVNNTQLTTLPESIGNLVRLQILYASNTQLTTLPDSIGNLINLRELNVNNTKLTTLPITIRNMINLEYLDIGRTTIKSTSNELYRLPSIKTLILEDLSLDRLPNGILDHDIYITPHKGNDRLFSMEPGIYIQNLSLSKQPVSLFYQKKALIRRYFYEKKVSVNSAKIIFLGDGEVGKTYTLKRLLNGGKKATTDHSYPTQTTHGVLIKPYHVTVGKKQYDIKLWDFGGQQIMHSMHRCFLTERSCYVVMLSTRTDRDLLGQARYWLRTVNSFAPNAPVIILVNQWTKNLIRVDEFRLKEEFKSIKEFLYFSVVEAEDEQFLTLKDSIMDQVRQLDCYGMEFPESWYGLMTDLENETHNYISKTTYHTMCFDRGLRYEDSGKEGVYDWLLDWFNDLGVCFSYNKNSNSQRLDDYKLLNPQWLTRAAYVLINSGETAAENGILTKNQIKAVLTDTEPLDFDDLGSVSYNEKEIEYILEILRKFQISYKLPDGRELIPILCNENSSGSVRPEWFIPSEMQHTSYEFQYEYLPDTIIHRLMIYCYQSHFIVRDRWRKGIKVDFSGEYSGLTAVIDSGKENQSISIDVYSDGRIPCWEFLSKLREEILQINSEISLNAEDYINMETDGKKDQFSVAAVLNRRARGKTDYPGKNYNGDYEISDILGFAFGPVNTVFIEEAVESRNEVVTGDILNQILARLNEENNSSKIRTVLESVIKALQAMQNNKMYYRNQDNSNDLENYRNRYVSEYLRAAGYDCSDQQPGGTGATGKKSGERDFVVRDKSGSELLIYEGLNLKAVNNTKIDQHLKKLLENYNPTGLQYGILATYFECDKNTFKSITRDYKKHISNYKSESFNCVGKPITLPSTGQFLSCMKMQYETGGLDFFIYHIIARIAP